MSEGKPPRSATVLGCVAAILLFVSVGHVLLFLWAWTGAHCRPIPGCERSGESHLLYHSALLAVAAIGFGFLMRTIARAVVRAHAERPGVALAVNIAAIVVLVPIGFYVVLLGLVSIPWPR